MQEASKGEKPLLWQESQRGGFTQSSGLVGA